MSLKCVNGLRNTIADVRKMLAIKNKVNHEKEFEFLLFALIV